MPVFKLRSWAEQTLYDCQDYEVEADTIEQAAAKLKEAQRHAEEEDCEVEVEGITPIGYASGVSPLDPEEIVNGDSGISAIDEDGNVQFFKQES